MLTEKPKKTSGRSALHFGPEHTLDLFPLVIAFLESLRTSGRGFAMASLLTTICLSSAEPLLAQDSEVSHAYRFEILKANNLSNSKAALFHLNQWSETTLTIFIDQLDCFKMKTLRPISYSELQEYLALDGHVLIGRILCGDGSTLDPRPIQEQSTRAE